MPQGHIATQYLPGRPLLGVSRTLPSNRPRQTRPPSPGRRNKGKNVTAAAAAAAAFLTTDAGQQAREQGMVQPGILGLVEGKAAAPGWAAWDIHFRHSSHPAACMRIRCHDRKRQSRNTLRGEQQEQHQVGLALVVRARRVVGVQGSCESHHRTVQ